MMQKANVIPLAEILIKTRESLKLIAYKDGAGIPTIAWGATTIDGRKVNMIDTCTQEQAEMWLKNRIEEDYNKLELLFCHMHDVNLEDNQAAAILSFIYNCGFTAFQNSSMAKDLILGRVDKVSSDLMKWDKIRVDGNLVFSLGLFNRRMQESRCFMNEKKCI